MNSRMLLTTTSRATLFVIALFARGLCLGQSTSATTQPVAGDYAPIQINPHSRVWQNAQGQSITEIATGMNYWDGQEWVPSNPQFVVSPGWKRLCRLANSRPNEAGL
jgi:hypothetical protein